MQGEARLRGLFQTKRHPCWSVGSVLIRRIRADPCSLPASGAQPACA